MNRLRIALCVACAFALVVIFVFSSLPVTAHGGGLDAMGGHPDTKKGNYHAHQGTCKGRTFASKQAAVSAGCQR